MSSTSRQLPNGFGLAVCFISPFVRPVNHQPTSQSSTVLRTLCCHSFPVFHGYYSGYFTGGVGAPKAVQFVYICTKYSVGYLRYFRFP